MKKRIVTLLSSAAVVTILPRLNIIPARLFNVIVMVFGPALILGVLMRLINDADEEGQRDKGSKGQSERKVNE